MNTPTIDPKTVTAEEVLDGVEEIVLNEMMARGEYISSTVEDVALAEQGAICRGHNACAVGSVWLASGITHESKALGYDGIYVTSLRLPGVMMSHDERLEWLSEQGYHGPLAAYTALNEASQELLDAHEDVFVSPAWASYGPLEGLFEGAYLGDPDEGDYLIEPSGLLPIIERARELLSS